MADRVPSVEQDARNLQAIMLQAQRRARAELQNPPGSTDKARRFAEARAAARLRDLDADMRRYNFAAREIVGRQTQAQFDRGVARADRLNREAGLAPPDAAVIGGLTGAETERARIIARQYLGDVDKAFDSIKKVAGRSITEARALGWDQAKFKRLLAGGAIDGVPAATLKRVREIAKTIAIDGYVEVPNRNGGTVTRFKPTTYADLVYQTAMSEAYNVATVERLVARGSYYVKIIGSDSRNFCTAYKGKVYYIGPGTDPLGKFPPLSKLPRGGAPFHPRCTKRYVPFNPATASAAELEAATPGPAADDTLGKTPAEAQQIHEAEEAQKKLAASTPSPSPAPQPRGTPAETSTPALAESEEPPMPESTPEQEAADRAVAEARARFERRGRGGSPPPPAAEVAAAVARVDRTAIASMPAVNRLVDDGLARVAAARFELPEVVRPAQPGRLQPWVPTSVGLRAPSELVVNPAWPHWSDARVFAPIEYARRRQSTPAASQPVLVAAGASLHVRRAGIARVRELSAMPLLRFVTIPQRAAIAEAISSTATDSPITFVSQVFAMLVEGRPVPDELMVIYRRLGGPMFLSAATESIEGR